MAAPKKPAWKPDGASPAAPQGGKAAWKPSGAGPSGPSGPSWLSSRWTLAGLVSAGLLAVPAVAVYVLMWLRPDPAPALVIIEAGYETNLAVPHNAAGRGAARALSRWAGEHGDQKSRGDLRKIDTRQAPLEVGGEAALKAIQALRGGLTAKPPKKVAVYVAAHGIALPDGDGVTAYLVPEGFDPARPNDLFKFDRLLEALAELPGATQKILLLDTGGVRVSWALGQFQPSFTAALEGERYQGLIARIDNLSVIVAAGKNQPSWVAEEFGMSAFGHFVLEGLRGGASAKGGNTVTALELHEYVAAEVEQWSRHNRRRLQQPALYPMKEEGRSRAGQMTLAHHEGFKQADLPAHPLSEAELDACGKSWAKLREMEGLSPWAHAPHRWRRCQELLVRAEELARAGDADHSRKAREESDKLAGEIDASLAAPFDSMRLSIPMLESVGVPFDPRDGWLARFTAALAGNDVPGCVKMAEAIEKEAGDRWAKQVRRLRATERVLRHVAADPGARAAACKPLLEKLDDALEPWRPGEAKYLGVVLDEKAPPAPMDAGLAAERWKQVGKALLVRLRAEEAALGIRSDAPPAPDAVLPWVRGFVARGDRDRREAQDLLFTTLPERWKEAEGLLARAEKQYADAEETARYIQRALRDCHAALARLPHLSRWLATTGADEDTLNRAAATWKAAHDLHTLLRQPPPDKRVREAAARINSLREKDLNAGMSELDRLVASAREGLADPRLQDGWHRIDAFLRMPVADAELRARLARAGASISRGLHDDGRKEKKAGGAEDTPEKIRAEARRHAELARAAAEETDDDRKALAGPLDSPSLGPKLVALMAERAGKANEMTVAAARAGLAEAGRDLVKATAIARTLDGWAAPMLESDPVHALRQLRLHDLLAWQAERAYLDHLSGGKLTADGKPYFQAATAAYLGDAERRVDPESKHPARREAVKKVRDRASAASPLALEWSAAPKGEYSAAGGTFHITDEPEAERFYKLRGPGDIEGASVRWASATAGLAPPEPGVRPWPLGETHRAAIKAVGDLYVRHYRKGVKYSIDAWFRGQRVAAEMSITIHREPDHLAAAPPRPPRASVAVLTNGPAFAKHIAGQHAICIVLDCSGSMKAAVGKGNRLDAARQALHEVLAQMPDGVNVSLLAFSAEGFQKTDAEKERGGIRVVWERHAWRQADLKEKMKEVDALKPDANTPLMRSLLRARAQLPVEFKNRRSIVAITDGGDYNFYRPARDLDADIKKKGTLDTIARFLTATFGAPNDDIRVNVIGFGVDEGDMKPWELRAHKELKPALRKIGGTYHDAKDTADLVRALTRNLLRLEYELDAPPGAADSTFARLVGDIGRHDGTTRENLRWLTVPPGERSLIVPLMKGVVQEVRTEPGDALVLEMLPREGGMRFRRWMYIRSGTYKAAFRMNAEPENKWTLGALENWQANSGRMTAMATLEQDLGPAVPGSFLQMVHPRWSWFELEQTDEASKEKTKRTPAATRVSTLYNYPAPAFGLEVPFWEQKHSARLKAWWLDSTSTKPIASSLEVRGTERLLDLQEKKLNFETAGDEAVLESVVLEKSCLVPFRGDGKEDVTVADCLVVRLRYPRGKGPYFAEVGKDRWPGGAAYRYFHEAGKSTSIFWPARAEDVARLKELRVYSVAALKAAGLKAEIPMGVPNSGNTRPEEIKR